MKTRFLAWLSGLFDPRLEAEDDRSTTGTDCPECGGLGMVESLGPTRCEACNGTGKRSAKGPRS